MELRILGPLEAVADDGTHIALGGPRMRAVLARLLVQPNTIVSTDSLVDAVWGESPPASATGALQVHVHALRKALGTDRIVTRTPGYSLRVEQDELDAARFELLVEEGVRLLETGSPAQAAPLLTDALALWRGGALADLAYEPFARQEAERLEELRLVALEQRLEAELELGRDAELVGEPEALLAQHPLREVSPALGFEQLIETMFGLAADGKVNRKGMPNPLHLPVIARHHFGDVRLPFPPVWMQRIGLALGAPLGRLMGFRPTYEAAAPTAPTALEV